MKRFLSLVVVCVGISSAIVVSHTFAQTVVRPREVIECDINNDGTCNNGTGFFSWTPDVINGTQSGGTTTVSGPSTTTAATGGFTQAELAYCKKITKSNASKCCGEKPIGTAKQCKNYITDPAWAKGADALYCLNIDTNNFGYCCNILSIDTNKCAQAEKDIKDAAAVQAKNNADAVMTSSSGALLYSKETFPGVNVPLVGVGADPATFCKAVTSDTANYCCNTTQLGEAESCKQFGIIRSSGQQSNQQANQECSTISATNGEWCCALNDFGPADQCKTFKENSYFSIQRVKECKNVTNENFEWCCVMNQYGPKDTCNTFKTNANGTGAVVGGAQGTTITAQNGGFLGEGSAAQSQASALQLQACNAIKFITLFDIVVWAKCIIVSALLPLIFTLAFVTFIWGVFRFMYSEDKNKKQEAKNFILWGIIGLFVMVSLWGIIAILGQTFGIRSVVPFLQTDYLSKNKTPLTTTTTKK